MDDSVSKSEKKRQAEALQKLGVILIALNLDQLKSLPLPDYLHKTIIDAKAIKSHGAKRRQAQLIGKLMRSTDFEAIMNAYEQTIQEKNSAAKALFSYLRLTMK
jgi:ribosome-associated protein